ncbi:hypothetical protein Tco_1168803, partial [Tanacetum coccineum]
TDISKITRKPSRTGKHRHEKRKSSIEAKDAKPKPEKNHTLDVGKHTRMMDLALFSLTKQAQAVTSRNDSLAIRGKKIMIQGL